MFKKKVVKLLAGLLASTIVAGMAAPSVKAAEAYYIDAYGVMHEVSAEEANSTGGVFMAYDIMPNWEEIFANPMFNMDAWLGANLDNTVEETVEESTDVCVDNGEEVQEEANGTESAALGFAWYGDPIQMAIQMHQMAFFMKTGMIFTEY